MGNVIEQFYNPDSQLMSVLVILAILVVGLILSKFITALIGKSLKKAKLNERLNSNGSSVDFVKIISKLVYYVLVLNVVLIVLEKLGITAVLDPLKNLADQFMNALPRVIGAGIIFYAGWIIAQLASSFVEIAASKLDQLIEKKNLKAEFKVSKFLSAFVFGGVLVPMVVAGLDFLNVKAISEPAISMINEFMNAVPNIVGAGLILLVSFIIGRFITFLLTGLLQGMNIDELPEKMGFKSLIPAKSQFSNFIASIVLFFIMLTATTAAVEKLNIHLISEIFSRCVDFAGGIALGAVILIIGNFLANLAHKHLSSVKENSQMAGIARYSILGLVAAMGLQAMGLADQIVSMAFGLTLGSLAISFAISFGIGGIEAAKRLTSQWVDKK